MPCGGCGRRDDTVYNRMSKDDLTGGYANLTDRQLKARLEMYKKRFCSSCVKRYDCDYKCYIECKKSEANKVTT
jgi:hypothetical protein